MVDRPSEWLILMVRFLFIGVMPPFQRSEDHLKGDMLCHYEVIELSYNEDGVVNLNILNNFFWTLETLRMVRRTFGMVDLNRILPFRRSTDHSEDSFNFLWVEKNIGEVV